MARPANSPRALPRVGGVLRRLREAGGLTVAEAARVCGVNRTTWYRREHLGAMPVGGELERFCAAVDPQCPGRAKAQILAAAGLLTTRETHVLTRIAEETA